jgi:hypothetical protein
MSILERLLALLPPSPIDSELLEALGFFADANKDLRKALDAEIINLLGNAARGVMADGQVIEAKTVRRKAFSVEATSLDQTRQALRGAKTCANKFACLALLGFGLIAIEAQALTLYFLQG